MKKSKLFLALYFATFALIAAFVGASVYSATGNEALGVFVTLGIAVLPFVPVVREGVLSACGTISAAITTDCNNVPTPGIQPRIFIANKSDIASFTLDPTNPTLCTAIVMVVTKQFYKYTGLKKIGKTGMKTIKGKFKNFVEHNGEIAILQNDPTTKKEIDNLLNANCVIIVENKSGGSTGNRKYEVYGLESGLECEVTNDKDNADTQGGYLLNFKTPDGETEPHIPATFFDTDLATTEAALGVIAP